MYEFAVDRKTLVSGSLVAVVGAVLVFGLGVTSGLALATPRRAATAVVLAAHVGIPAAATAPSSSTSPPPAVSEPAAPASVSDVADPPPAVETAPATAVRDVVPRRQARRWYEVEPEDTEASIFPVDAAELDPAAAEPTLRYRLGQPVPATPYGGLIHRVARRHRLNPELVAAVVWAESGFDSAALSPRGARGLMQVLPDTAERFGIPGEHLFDPEQNLAAGARYLSWLVDRYGERLDLVLGAYNAGEGIVERLGAVPPYAETVGYVERVRNRLGGGETAALR